MTCVYCESDTAERGTYVTYGGGIFCDWDCLAEFYVEKELSKSPEEVEQSSKLIHQ